VDLLGLEKLTNAFGLLLLFQGVAATVGAPLAGNYNDIDHGIYDIAKSRSECRSFLKQAPLILGNVYAVH